jgi:hypothetical protein
MRSAEAGFKARAVSDTVRRTHLTRVASGNIRSTLAMDRRALAMGCRGALAVNRARVLGMHRRLTRATRAAHDFSEVQPVIVRDFAPAFPCLVCCYNAIEALPRLVSQ